MSDLVIILLLVCVIMLVSPPLPFRFILKHYSDLRY